MFLIRDEYRTATDIRGILFIYYGGWLLPEQQSGASCTRQVDEAMAACHGILIETLLSIDRGPSRQRRASSFGVGQEALHVFEKRASMDLIALGNSFRGFKRQDKWGDHDFRAQTLLS